MTKHHKIPFLSKHKFYGGLCWPPLSDPPGVLQCTPNPRACCSHAPSTEEHRCVIFFGVEKKGKSGARFAGQKKSVEQLSFILNTKLYGRFRSHQKLRRTIWECYAICRKNRHWLKLTVIHKFTNKTTRLDCKLSTRDEIHRRPTNQKLYFILWR